MTQPLTTFRAGIGPGGKVRIDRAIDEQFRKALLDGVPVHLRPKMIEALAQMPNDKSLAHSVGYFGDELPVIQAYCRPLVDEIHDYLRSHRALDGFRDWLIATGFTNEYHMIKVMYDWARAPTGIVRLRVDPAMAELKCELNG